MSTFQTISFADKLSQFSDHWNPRIASKYNDNEVHLARLEGALDIEFRDSVRHLEKGEMIVMPKGVEYRPFCEDECHIMVMDREGEPNTGANPPALTRETLEAI